MRRDMRVRLHIARKYAMSCSPPCPTSFGSRFYPRTDRFRFALDGGAQLPRNVFSARGAGGRRFRLAMPYGLHTRAVGQWVAWMPWTTARLSSCFDRGIENFAPVERSVIERPLQTKIPIATAWAIILCERGGRRGHVKTHDVLLLSKVVFPT